MISLELLITSFIAGILTVLTPCSLPLIPTILGSSLQKKSYKRIFVIIFSLGLSVFLFTIFIKAGVTSLGISEDSLRNLSALILILIGIFTLFPYFWTFISVKIGIEQASAESLQKTKNLNGFVGAAATGIALGPVFTSCSPLYGYILFAVLPSSFINSIIYLTAFILGLCIFLFIIAFTGIKFLYKFRWVTNPNGNFKKALGIFFILVGVLIFFKIDKQIESALLQNEFILNILPNRLEQNFIDEFVK